MNVIRKEIARQQQDVVFSELITHEELRLRIRIKSNAYQFQQSATIEIFHAASLEWRGLAKIEPGAMRTPAGLYMDTRSSDELVSKSFEADRRRLLEDAAVILNCAALYPNAAPKRVAVRT